MQTSVYVLSSHSFMIIVKDGSQSLPDKTNWHIAAKPRNKHNNSQLFYSAILSRLLMARNSREPNVIHFLSTLFAE